MKRVTLSAVLLAVIFAGAFIGGEILGRTADELYSRAEETQRLYESGDTESALKSAALLNEKWRSKEKLLSLMMADEKISELSFSVARIEPFISSGSDEASAELQSIMHRLDRIKQTELPHWHNIL